MDESVNSLTFYQHFIHSCANEATASVINTFISQVMGASVSDGIRIKVSHRYREEHSDPEKHNFVFFYRITIENLNNFNVKLLRRHWEIFDSNGVRTIVDGDGVVGEQPEFRPGELFSYESACSLETAVGKMSGHYQMVRLDTNEIFQVSIPEFQLFAPFILN